MLHVSQTLVIVFLRSWEHAWIPSITTLSLYVGCPKFMRPANGLLDPDEDVYSIGQIVTVYCRQGYNLIGDETLVCTNAGDWHGIIPTCSDQTTGVYEPY